jgi:hypothetical protein
MIAEPPIWRCIEAVAAALLAYGKLSAAQVHTLAEGLPDPPELP